MQISKGHQNNQSREDNNTRVHISFSELRKWSQCPYSHKLAYIDSLKLFNGNSYTAFGSAAHKTIEDLYTEAPQEVSKSAIELFQENLQKSLEELDASSRDTSLEAKMPQQGSNIFSVFSKEFEKYFTTDIKIFSIEEEIYEDIELDGVNLKFKGFIDMVLKDSKDNYHIVDWKTCSWGWNAKKRSDPMNTYQLMYYKKYFAKKHSIPLEKIKVHFGLLKRTSSKDHVEMFEITSGPRRINNATDLLVKAIQNISKKNFVKNRLSCSRCEYYKTEHCS